MKHSVNTIEGFRSEANKAGNRDILKYMLFGRAHREERLDVKLYYFIPCLNNNFNLNDYSIAQCYYASFFQENPEVAKKEFNRIFPDQNLSGFILKNYITAAKKNNVIANNKLANFWSENRENKDVKEVISHVFNNLDIDTFILEGYKEWLYKVNNAVESDLITFLLKNKDNENVKNAFAEIFPKENINEFINRHSVAKANLENKYDAKDSSVNSFFSRDNSTLLSSSIFVEINSDSVSTSSFSSSRHISSTTKAIQSSTSAFHKIEPSSVSRSSVFSSPNTTNAKRSYSSAFRAVDEEVRPFIPFVPLAIEVRPFIPLVTVATVIASAAAPTNVNEYESKNDSNEHIRSSSKRITTSDSAIFVPSPDSNLELLSISTMQKAKQIS